MSVDAQTKAWIFYATGMVAQNAPAPRTDISNAADAINHAVPTQAEMNGSLRWLEQNGLVKADGKFYSLTNSGSALLQSSQQNASTVMKVWDNITKAFAAFSVDP